MTHDKIDAREVKPKETGFYLVMMFHFKKEAPDDADYIKDWIEFDGDNWVYEDYSGSCRVCSILKRDCK